MDIHSDTMRDLQYRFLTDRRIAMLNNQIAAIYNISIPIVLVKNDGISTIVYSDEVEYEVNRIRSIISDIIASDYSELLDHE